jgi:hypothetical protein
MIEALVYQFLETCGLALIAFLLGRYRGKTLVIAESIKGAGLLIFIQVWVITFCAKVIFIIMGNSLAWADQLQVSHSEFLLPLTVGTYSARQLILMKSQGANYILKRQYHLIFLVLIFIAWGVGVNKINISDIDQARPGVAVIVSRQDAERKTQRDMTYTFLSRLEDVILSGIKDKLSVRFKARGESVPELEWKSESHFIESNNIKLAIIRVFSGELSNSASIVGFKDDELIRVLCVVDGNLHVEVSVGPCGNKVQEVFDVDLSRRLKAGEDLKGSLELKVKKSLNGSFLKLGFGESIFIEVPKNWTYRNKNIRDNIQVSVDSWVALEKLPVFKSENIILMMANTYTEGSTSSALVRLSVRCVLL